MSTFVKARSALHVGDDARLHELCVEVARLDGIESTVALLAMSDAEHAREPRRRTAMLWLLRHVANGLPRPPR